MGDKTYHIGDIHADHSVVSIGENITAINRLNASNQTELAQALKTLTDAVVNSKSLSTEEKQEQVDIITQMSAEAAKSKPNKSVLKALWSSLVATLRVIPDVAKAVEAAIPVIEHLHW